MFTKQQLRSAASAALAYYTTPEVIAAQVARAKRSAAAKLGWQRRREK